MSRPEAPIESATGTDAAPTVVLELSLAQAAALVEAADLYSRLGIGQLEEVSRLVRAEVIPAYANGAGDRTPATTAQCDEVERLMKSAKNALGFHANGSRGIGHAHNDLSVSRAYEVRKVLEQTLALHRDPNPSFRGVNYDGLIVRYTDDPAPRARIVP